MRRSGSVLLILSAAVLGLGASCLTETDASSPRTVQHGGISVDTGYTPGVESWETGTYRAFTVRWSEFENADYYQIRMLDEPITSNNWSRALVMETVSGGRDSALVEIQPEITNACIGCGICVDKCPHGAITLIDGKAVIDDSLCTSCGECLRYCPADAVSNQVMGAEYYFAVRAFNEAGVPSDVVLATTDSRMLRYRNYGPFCGQCWDSEADTSTCYMVYLEPGCPTDAIYWDSTYTYHIDQDLCIYCGRCYDHCQTTGLQTLRHYVE